MVIWIQKLTSLSFKLLYGNEIDMKKVEQDEIKEEAIVIADMSMINDIEGLSIIDEEDEVPEAAEIGFDDLDMD